MRNLPGLRLTAFLTVVFAVGLAVYSRGQQKQSPSGDRKHELLVIRFGWDEVPGEREIINATPQQISDVVGGDEKRYFINEWLDDSTNSPKGTGKLKDCVKPKSASTTTAAIATTAMGATATAVSSTTMANGPAPGASPKGAKTQSTGVVSLNSVDEAQKFFNLLATATPTPTPSP